MIIIYIKDKLSNESLAIIKITIEIYLIDNLKINIFIENNVLISQKIKLNSKNNKIIIELYKNLFVNIEIIIKDSFRVRKIIRIKEIITILILSTILILIIYNNTLLSDRDFLFKSQRNKNLNIFAYIINFSLFFIQLRNILDRLV